MDEGSHGYSLYWLNSGPGSRLEALVSGLWVLEFAHYALSVGSSWDMDFSSQFRELDWVLCSELQFWDWLIEVGERVDIAMKIAGIFLHPPLYHKEGTGISFSLWREGSMPREHAFFFSFFLFPGWDLIPLFFSHHEHSIILRQNRTPEAMASGNSHSET